MAAESVRVNVRMPAELYAILDSCVIARRSTSRGKRETITSALLRAVHMWTAAELRRQRKPKGVDQRLEGYAEQLGLLGENNEWKEE